MTARCGVRIESAIVLLTAMLFLLLGAPSAGAQPSCEPGCETFSSLDGKSIYQVCSPREGSGNGAAVVFAHGYLPPEAPKHVPDYPIGETTLSALVTQLGFVYASSSFPDNGLAILEGVEDVVDLATVASACAPGPVFLVGASEGGAITALAVESHPWAFAGGLALCGPIGSFQKQINHYGDFRVVFDYFFPGILPGTAIDPDPDDLLGPPYPPVRQFWDTWYVPRIAAALQAYPNATAQLLKVTRVPFDANDLNTVGEAVVGNLWYNVFATYDAIDKLKGQPFDNRWRFYRGSSNDWLLNLRVARYRADLDARMEIAANYETSGRIDIPVVTAHTTGDPIVPYWHELFYRWKTWRAGSGPLHTNLPVFKYGHCTFDVDEATAAFGILLAKVQAQQ